MLLFSYLTVNIPYYKIQHNTNIFKEEAIEGWLEVMESKHSIDPAQLVELTV
jgi:hypothetical protein